MNPRLERLKALSRLLDNQFQGPLGFRFGLDPLIGLIPGFGDILTSLISFFIVVEAFALGCSPVVLMRMLFNIFLENFLKVVPGFGQIFDFYWKSNVKNVDLVEKYLQAPTQTRRSSVVFLMMLAMGFILGMTLILALSIWTIVFLVRFFQEAF